MPQLESGKYKRRPTKNLKRNEYLDKNDLKFMLLAVRQKELADGKTTDQSNRICALLRIAIEKVD